MKLIETELTPELALMLIGKANPKQRRPSRAIVANYARTIKEGRWRLVPDPILVDPDEHMFNGGHRCAAVVIAHRAIPVYIGWDADPALFDVIDVGRRRQAGQFISDGSANERAAAARVMLWYERRFEQALNAQSLQFDVSEILAKAEEQTETFTALISTVRSLYEYTTLSKAVSLAAFSIAYGLGYLEEITAFVNGVVDPMYLETTDPARLLAERFRKQAHRGKRRQQLEDWVLLVRAFNLHLEGRSTNRIVFSDVWPRVAETETEYNRRRNALQEARRAKRNVGRTQKEEAA